MHSPAYVAATSKEAADAFYPGFARAVASVAKERGWGPMTRPRFDSQLTPEGAMLIGTADEVAEKVLHHSEALGGISRVTFQMNASSLPHGKIMEAIDLIGSRVAPALHRDRISATA